LAYNVAWASGPIVTLVPLNQGDGRIRWLPLSRDFLRRFSTASRGIDDVCVVVSLMAKAMYQYPDQRIAHGQLQGAIRRWLDERQSLQDAHCRAAKAC